MWSKSRLNSLASTDLYSWQPTCHDIQQKLMSLFVNPEDILQTVLSKEIEHQRKGEYMEAEQCRREYLKKKEEQQNRQRLEMQARHKSEQANLKAAEKDELDCHNKEWDSRMQEFQKEGEEALKRLRQKHNEQTEKAKKDLDRTLPYKLKQSSDLLNLRKMEEHLAKQKKYTEAHELQTKATLMAAREKQAWDLNRKMKMDVALNTLKDKHNSEMECLKQKLSNGRAEKVKERRREKQVMELKFENLRVELRKQQEKELLGWRGEFKSLGGTSSMIRSRNSFGNFE